MAEIATLTDQKEPKVDETYRGIQIENPDGTFSSERTITIGFEDKYYNIPTLIDGIQKTEEEATELFIQNKITAVGVAGTMEEAVKKAGQRSQMLGMEGQTLEKSEKESLSGNFDLTGALKAGYTYKDIVKEIGPTINYDVESAIKEGYNYQEIAEYLSKQTFPPYSDIARALNRLQLPKITDTNNLTAMDRYRIDMFLKAQPPEMSHATRTNAILEMNRRQYGEIRQQYPSFMEAVKNLPENIIEIVENFGALIVGIPMTIGKHIKEFHTKSQLESKVRIAQVGGPLLTEEETEQLKKPYYIEEMLERGVKGIREGWPYFKEDPLLHAGFWMEEHPADTLLLGTIGWQLGGLATRGLLRGVTKTTGKQFFKDIAKTTGRQSWEVGNIEIARAYSKNPLTKTFLQKPFDVALERWPRLKGAIEKYKGGKITSQMRNKYEEMNFIERVRLHQEIFSELEKLSEAELKIVMPYLEGRLHFMDDLPGNIQGFVDLSKGIKKPKIAEVPEEIVQFWEAGGIPSRIGRGTENVNPQRIKDFEGWYRNFQKEIEHGFKLDEKMSIQQIEDVIYKPIEIETGLSREAIMEELGDFLPTYVHHFFPEKAADKLAIHFAETTGKTYKPGALKRRKGAVGYSEDMTEVLPRLTSSYVKWKNTQAFLKEFEDTFATVVNFKDIQKTTAGLKVGEELYPNHKIVSPNGILRFYKGEVDAWKEIAKKMDDTVDFDEAVIGMFQELQAEIGVVAKPYVGVTSSTKVWLVPEEAYGKLQSLATPFLGSKDIQHVVKLGIDIPQQIWKDSVLSLSPRWIKNNVMGDIIFNSFEGVGPFSYVRAMQSYGNKYSDILPDEVIRASFANVMKYNPKLGSTEKTLIGGWAKALGETKPAKIARSISDVGYKINTAVEQPFVRALYIKLARQEAKKILKSEKLPLTDENILATMGKIKDTPELLNPIVSKVKETLPVFNNLDHFGRMYGRRMSPFINWYKFMIIYASKLPAKHPFKLAGVRGLSELGEKEREQAFLQYFPYMKDMIEKEGGIPKRFSGLWPIGIDEKTGEGIFFNARGLNPFRTVEDIIEGRFMNMMSPFVKVGVERSLGVDSFTRQKFTTPYPLDVSPDGEVSENMRPKPSFFTHIARQFPQFTLLEQTLTPAQQYSTGTVFNPKPIRDSITGEPKYPIYAIDKILNYMGIDRKTMDVEKWFYNHEDRIRAKGAQTQKNLMFEPHAIKLEEFRLILQNIQSDEKTMESIRKAIKNRIRYKEKTKAEKFKKIKE